MGRRFLTAAACALVTALAAPATFAAVGVDSQELRDAVAIDGIREHQAAFQEIADANGGTRASGRPGYDASVDYVVERLSAAGYDPVVQPFLFDFFQELAPAEFERISPDPRTYVNGFPDGDFVTMDYSGSGDGGGRRRPSPPPHGTAGGQA